LSTTTLFEYVNFLPLADYKVFAEGFVITF
jgi:hypothetical protein